jgi:predicted O-methyltransferase YrrM
MAQTTTAAKQETKSMDYPEFYKKFGGSARTKHIAFSRSGRDSLARAVYGQVRRAVLNPGKEFAKRRFQLPSHSELPRDYIRLDPWEMEYMFIAASRARKGIVEIGRFNGGSTFLMSCANGNVPIWSLDIAPQDDDLLRSNFRKYGVGGNVDLIIGDSQNTKYPQVKEFDVLFIDGDHTYEGCMADINNWYPHLAIGGHLLFHDSYATNHPRHGVQNAVSDFLESHPELQIIQSPYISPTHWNYPTGSIAHFIKRG